MDDDQIWDFKIDTVILFNSSDLQFSNFPIMLFKVTTPSSIQYPVSGLHVAFDYVLFWFLLLLFVFLVFYSGTVPQLFNVLYDTDILKDYASIVFAEFGLSFFFLMIRFRLYIIGRNMSLHTVT